MSFQLLREIRTFLQELFADSAFRNPAVEDETEEGAFISPRLFIGALPPKRKQGQTNEDFPFIVVRAPSGEDGEENSDIQTQIICGIYTAEDEEGGTNDIHNALDKIRSNLLQQRILGGTFELQLPLSWTTGQDEERNQPHPYYLGEITANWRTLRRTVLQSVETEIDVYGTGYR